jgi:hypothetical protein
MAAVLTGKHMPRNKQEAPQLSLGLWSKTWPVADSPMQIKVGDLSLTLSRLNHEWQLNYAWTKKGNDGEFSCEYLDSTPRPRGETDRIAMETMTCEVTLQPRLADRPVVVRPYSPLTLPARNRITLYVSTPLWLAVTFSPTLHRELPAQQLSDTWMGALTGHGELCYGSHTHARLDPELLLKRPFRALTPITIHNEGDQDSRLERLSIPAPFLSLYAKEEQLLTEPLAIAMDSKKQQGVVEIGKLDDAVIVTRPRQRADRGILVNAWENLIG